MAKQHYLFLERFNNYFNRKIIKYDTLNDYITHSRDNFCPLSEGQVPTSFDFNPNDNITTEVICNDVPFDPDYILIFNDDTDETIASRWFIVEQKRNRQGQWVYYLKRDVIADNLDSLLNAPIFVEKAMLPEDDPFILNDEGMSLNQIKKYELLLKDNSQTAWIVGYIAKNAGGSDVNIQVDDETIPFDYLTLGEIASDIGTTEGILNSLLNFDGDDTNKAYFTNNVRILSGNRCDLGQRETTWSPVINMSPDFSDGSFQTASVVSDNSPFLFEQEGYLGASDVRYFIDAMISHKTSWVNTMNVILGRSYYLTYNQLTLLKQYAGRYVRYNGKYYQLSISEVGTNSITKNNLKKNGTYACLDNSAETAVTLSSGKLTTGTYSATEPNAYVLNEIKSEEVTVVITLNLLTDYATIPQLNTIISSGRRPTSDQEYDIFAIPLNVNIQKGVSDYFDCKEVYARRIASAIGIQQSEKVYDLQLLPYCPVPDCIKEKGVLKVTDLSEHKDFDYIVKNMSDIKVNSLNKSYMTWIYVSDDEWTCSATVHLGYLPAGKTPIIDEIEFAFENAIISNVNSTISGDDIIVTFTYNGADPSTISGFSHISVYYHWQEDDVPCGIIFYLKSATFSNVINQQIVIDKSKKILSNCYMWRLNSPNYQGAFDFNIAKNGGRVLNFNIFCTYKPFTPMIKVAPNFEWMYGAEYQDNRGLICGGDFSLPRVQDEWISYQINNKNYQNIFNRDIQHLDYMQGLEMRNQLVSGAVGIFSDAVKGGVAGGMAGGGWGAVAGAVIGAGASAIGYGIDVDTMAKTHRENKQLSIDKFNYQLGNIKALPYTLTKVGSFDAVSKIFPFVEEYCCSDEELEAFENKIKYESMTVMRIGTLNDFMIYDGDIHYFKGSLIRNDEIADDSHVLNAIYEELLKGVYI